jgi:hypothetical protein
MARLSRIGSMVVTPAKEESELTRVLSPLTGRRLDNELVAQYYGRLGAIIGEWVQEKEGLEIEPLKKALLATAWNLGEASTLLKGIETGFHSELEIAAAQRVAHLLSLDPAIHSEAEAQKVLRSFTRDADRIAHVCLVASFDFPEMPGKRGRPPQAWYHQFTALLLGIAKEADIKPTLQKDRKSGARTGWLVEAAMALEGFLDPHMRSPSAEACGKRLERSLARLRASKRQKSSGR